MLDHTDLIDPLADIAIDLLGAGTRVEPVRTKGRVADSTQILLARSGDTKSAIHMSPGAFPDVVAEGCDRAHSFAEATWPELSGAVLLPTAQGRIKGCSYALFPWREPFPAGRIRWWFARRRVQPAILDWLDGLAGRARIGDAATYVANLDALAAFPEIDRSIADKAHAAIVAIEQGRVAPLHVPMHGDFWRGNILRGDSAGATPFAVIDWRGSRVDGYPLFDLIRLAESYRIGSARLRTELHRHAATLGASIADGEAQLLAALGHYVRNAGEMPPATLRAMAKSCVETHARALG